MSSDLMYTVGVDATPLETGVVAVERRLDASGIKFEEQPRKYAQASAQAFEQIFAAEKSLADFRAKAGFDQLSTGGKISAVQRELVALTDQRTKLEKGTAERAQAELAVEQKKLQLRQLLKVAAKEEADQAARLAPALDAAAGKMSMLQKGWANLTKGFSLPNIGTTLATALGINLQSISENIARFVTGVTKQEEEALKQLEALSDRAVEKSVANMRAMLSEEQRYQQDIAKRDQLLERIASRQISSTADLVKQKQDEIELADRIAQIQTYELKVAEERQKKFAEEMKLRADAAEKQFQTSLDELSSQEKIRVLKESILAIDTMLRSGALDKNKADEFSLKLQDRKNALFTEEARQRKEVADREQKAAGEHIATMDRLTALKFERLSVDDKIVQLAREERQIAATLARLKREGADTSTVEVSLMETQNRLADLRTQQARAAAEAERDIAKAQTDQIEAQRMLIAITTRRGREDKDLSDRELAEKVAGLRSELAQAQRDDPTGRYGYLYNQQRQALENAEFESGRRRGFRQQYAQEGERALLRYSAFDEQTLRQYIRPEDEKRAAKQASDIERITQLFEKITTRK